jgi:hypothetical protein
LTLPNHAAIIAARRDGQNINPDHISAALAALKSSKVAVSKQYCN